MWGASPSRSATLPGDPLQSKMWFTTFVLKMAQAKAGIWP